MQRSQDDIVRHTGIVESIGNGICKVRILQGAACQDCAAHNLCSGSESKEKVVEVQIDEPRVKVGQTVVVEATLRQGLHAVSICYIIPLILLVVSLAICISLFGEEVGALVSLAALSSYYFCIYLMREKIGRKFRFRISDTHL